MKPVLVAAITFADIIELVNRSVNLVEQQNTNRTEAVGAYRTAKYITRELHKMLDDYKSTEHDMSDVNTDKTFLRDLEALLDEEIARRT